MAFPYYKFVRKVIYRQNAYICGIDPIIIAAYGAVGTQLYGRYEVTIRVGFIQCGSIMSPIQEFLY